MGDEAVGHQRLRFQELHGAPDQLRRVMKRPGQRQLFVMRPPRVEPHRGPGSAPSEEYHSPPPGHRIDGLLPHLQTARGVHRHVHAPASGEIPQGGHHVRGLAGVEALAQPEAPDAGEAPARLSDEEDAGLPRRRGHRQETPQRSRAEHGDGLAGLHPAPLDSAQGAGQRLGEGRPGRGKIRRQANHIALRQPRGQRDVFAVRAVDEQEILAEVGASPPARWALPARSRVGRDHAVAFPDGLHPAADCHDTAGKLVPEDGGNPRNHHGMPATESFHVGAAGQRGLDLDQRLSGARSRHGDLLVPEIAGTVEDHGLHRGSPVTKTLTASRSTVRATPSARRERGRRWVMSPSTWICP